MKTEIAYDKREMDLPKSPSPFKVIIDEFKRDKIALFSLVLLTALLLFVFIVAAFLDQDKVTKIDFFSMFLPPSTEHWLGTDYGGRDVFGQLIIGTKNSFYIGFLITLITCTVGLIVGLVAGYFAGNVDNVIMRIIDFILIFPFLMTVIVFITLIPEFSVTNFVLIMSLFLWTSKARLIRSKVLSEMNNEYISASKVMGTPHWKIITFQLLPNISSLIIVAFTLNLAGNIGIESGLSYLGFGLPESTPSLGTLISYARNPDVLQNKWWIWLPASVMILVLMLCINFIGEALKRAADAKQRRN